MIFPPENQEQWDETHETHDKCDKKLAKFRFHEASLFIQARNRWVSEVSQVSLVGLFHSGPRPGLNFSAAHWDVPRPRLRATTSAQRAEAAHSLFVTSGLPIPGPTPGRMNGDHEVLRSECVRISGDRSLRLTAPRIICHAARHGSRRCRALYLSPLLPAINYEAAFLGVTYRWRMLKIDVKKNELC
jgi:hypothetical protein